MFGRCKIYYVLCVFADIIKGDVVRRLWHEHEEPIWWWMGCQRPGRTLVSAEMCLL